METDSRGLAAQPVRTDDRADMDSRSRDYSLGPPASKNNFQDYQCIYGTGIALAAVSCQLTVETYAKFQ